jgi:hypothetical protein
MNKRMGWSGWLRGLAALAVGLALLAPAGRAWADDKVTLTDGRVITGQITRELEGYVWIRVSSGGIVREEMLRPDQIRSIERDAPAAKAEAAAPAARPEPRARPAASGTPRAAVLTLGEGGDKDMVGIYMTAETLRRAIPLLEADGVSVLVLRIKSGGGALLEIQRLSDLIEFELKPKFRTVAWIDSAISAAAMTAHCLNEIYFTSQGNYGACTGWFGALQAVKGRELEEVLYMMEKISARGGHHPAIMRAMQVSADPEEFRALNVSGAPGALSATINPDGTVSWFADTTSGQHVLNPKGNVNILTFNAAEAERFKFSRGTADTLEDLARLMGFTELEWVGERVPGIIWPVSKAERLQMDFRDKTYRDQIAVQSYWVAYQQAIAVARAQQDRNERGRFVGKARQELNKIKSMMKNNPNLVLFVMNMLPKQYEEWLEEQEKLLRDLMR